MRERPPAVVERAYRAAIRLAPRRHRQRHGDAQLQLFLALWREERPSGAVRRTFWTVKHLWFAVWAGLVLRMSPLAPGRLAHALRADIRVAIRGCRRAPWYAGGVVTVLALGIALASVVFAVVDGVLFKPLPFPNADELFVVRAGIDARPQPNPEDLAMGDVAAWRAAAADVAFTAVDSQPYEFLKIDERQYWYRGVDARFFDVVGVRPMLGGFIPEDFAFEFGDGDNYQPVIVSHHWWTAKLAGDPAAIGRRITTSQREGRNYGYVVRGVLPPDFVFPLDFGGRPEAHVLTPVPASMARPGADEFRRFQVIARAGAASVPTLSARLRAASERRFTSPVPADVDTGGHSEAARVRFDTVDLVPVSEHLGHRARPVFRLVAAAAGVLLLLACINVAGLSLARGVDRGRDRAIRLSLGASRFALARMAAVEVSLLTVFATALALLLAGPLLRWTLGLLPASLTLLKVPAIDGRLFGAAAAIAAAVAALVTIWPAVFHSRHAGTLGPGSLALTTSRLGSRPRLLIVASQTALGFVLLVAGGLTWASLMRAWEADVGYRRDHTAIVHAFGESGRPDSMERLIAFRDAMPTLPGVARAAATTIQIFGRRSGGEVWSYWGPAGSTGRVAGVTERRVDHDFFAVTGLRIVDGQLPAASEWQAEQPIAVISEQAARTYWPGGGAVGQTLVWRRPDPADRAPKPRRVVAVVKDARYAAADLDPVGDIYFPGAIGRGTYGSFFMVSTSEPADRVLPSIVATAASHGMRLEQAATMEDAIFASVRHRVLPLWLFGGLSAMGLIVLAAGTIGLLAMTTAQRTREIGIRLALGSSPARLTRLLAREQATAIAVGVLVGAVVAWLAVEGLRSELYGVTPHHPGVWIAVTLTVFGVAALGSLVPARIAARLDPAAILRFD
jgi:predicted permease